MDNKVENKIQDEKELEKVVGGADSQEYMYVFHRFEFVLCTDDHNQEYIIDEDVMTNDAYYKVRCKRRDIGDRTCSPYPEPETYVYARFLLDDYKRFGGNLSYYGG